ncbi:MAG: cytochrome b/b6 domain-containing protein [Anaerolineales bacterium]|nr:cytochrome b/b6 domain-containing protein [Anaerolineales bacterium]
MKLLKPHKQLLLFILGLILLAGATGLVLAEEGGGEAGQEAPALSNAETAVVINNPPLHPTFPMLDADGENVLDSGKPVSTMTTCGSCHDTTFIESHSFHADVGLTAYAPDVQTSGQPWDSSPGLFGKWNPLTYGYLSPEGDERVDLTTVDWLRTLGVRHVGGGPATTSREGEPLTSLSPDANSVETSVVDPETQELVPWDWTESGTVEMNCFLCHMSQPNNAARKDALHAGDFAWANSATLLGSGILTQTNAAYTWNPDAFDADGELAPEMVGIQDPGNENCGLCHGLVHVDAQTPAVLDGCTPEQWSTITTGQIMSPQKISHSGINVADKEELRRSWDIHTERVVNCTDCHYSLNNPVYYQENDGTRPDHLTFDPRRIDLGEYLYRPLHQFAKGQSAEGTLAPEFDNSLRRCESCHDAGSTHTWLPYTDQHMSALSCESCHIPKMYASARQTVDWTVLNTEGQPQSDCRGMEGDGETFATVLVTGYEPVLLPRDNGDGSTPLAPHNLITSFYWVYGNPERPVPQRDLEAAWLDAEGNYHADILDLFDGDGDGVLADAELQIDNTDKEKLIAGRLADLGLDNPHISGEIRPYSINHNVTHGEWATKECATCHSEESRITQPMLLAAYTPGGVSPSFVDNGTTNFNGEIISAADGGLYYQPRTENDNLYVLGHNSVSTIDRLGALIFVLTLIGVVVHGGLRFVAARRHPHPTPQLEEVYMYTMYERLWHWLQTTVILVLIFTGLIIHKPDIFGAFSFRYVVQLHNVMALILVANAALALFYHLASGEIKQYLPEPKGFFNQAIVQVKFYTQGIFKGSEHPFEKSPQRKLNPLQQITYFGLLNVLLPLQILVGILMWGMQQWPVVTTQLGGLSYLAPFHTLLSWLLATFVVLHVYLTTTGPTPSAGIRAMIMGWDEVEVHPETTSVVGSQAD